MVKIIIDATGISVGRISSYAAKQALQGKEIIILNSEKAIITGNKTTAIARIKLFRDMGGSALRGPFVSKEPFKILKRSIRGMLPDYRRGRGREAWKRIKCYDDIPEEYKNEKVTKVSEKKLFVKHISLKELKEKS